MVNTIEITIIVIIIQIIYKYINLFIFKNKPKSYELLTDKIIRTLEENNKENKKKISSLETLIVEISEKNNKEHKKKISSLETLIVEIIVENEKAIEKIEELEKNDRINKETIKENNNSLETLITEKIKTLEKNIDNEIKIIDYEFERIINEYCIGNNDKITLRVEELEQYVDEINEYHEELSSTSSSRIDSMLNDIDRIKNPVSIGNNNLILSTDTDGVVGTIEFPRGMIISWIPPQYIDNEDETQDRLRPPAPVGWAYCDGTNGTPDLRCSSLIGVGFKDEKITREIDPREREEDNRISGVRGIKIHNFNYIANWHPNFMIGFKYLNADPRFDKFNRPPMSIVDNMELHRDANKTFKYYPRLSKRHFDEKLEICKSNQKRTEDYINLHTNIKGQHAYASRPDYISHFHPPTTAVYYLMKL